MSGKQGPFWIEKLLSQMEFAEGSKSLQRTHPNDKSNYSIFVKEASNFMRFMDICIIENDTL